MVQYPPDWCQLSGLRVAPRRFPAIMPLCLRGEGWGGDGRTGRWQSGSKFGPLCPSPTAHLDRSNIQLGTTHHCLVLGGRPVYYNHQQHQHVTEDQEAVHKKECSSICKSDSQIQCYQGGTIFHSILLSHPFLSRFKTSRRRSP